MEQVSNSMDCCCCFLRALDGDVIFVFAEVSDMDFRVMLDDEFDVLTVVSADDVLGRNELRLLSVSFLLQNQRKRKMKNEFS